METLIQRAHFLSVAIEQYNLPETLTLCDFEAWARLELFALETDFPDIPDGITDDDMAVEVMRQNNRIQVLRQAIAAAVEFRALLKEV